MISIYKKEKKNQLGLKQKCISQQTPENLYKKGIITTLVSIKALSHLRQETQNTSTESRFNFSWPGIFFSLWQF